VDGFADLSSITGCLIEKITNFHSVVESTLRGQGSPACMASAVDPGFDSRLFPSVHDGRAGTQHKDWQGE
jgi:hypothetical protein